MMHYEYEPVRGLPCELPQDETILWQGSPRWLTLVQHLCHLRFVTAYFGLLIAWAVIAANADGRPVSEAINAAAWLSALLGIAVGLLSLFALLCGRTTIYTITTRRVVLRYGIAFTKAVNVPLRVVEGAGLRLYSDGSGDIPLELAGPDKIAYLILWPHARPWHFKRPQPMLRGVPEAQRVAEVLRGAMAGVAALAAKDNAKTPEPAGAKAAPVLAGPATIAA